MQIVYLLNRNCKSNFWQRLTHKAVVGVAVFDGESDVGRVDRKRDASARRQVRFSFGPKRHVFVKRFAGAAPLEVTRALSIQPTHPHFDAPSQET